MAIKIDADHEKIVEAVSSRWQDWTHARRKKEKIWQECVMNYLVEVDESKYDAWPWRSQVADTMSQETGDTVASSIMNGLFPLNEKYFETNGEDDYSQRFAPKMQGYVEAQLHRARFIESTRPWVKQLSVIGNAPYIGSWGPVARPVKRRVRQTDLRTQRISYPVRTVSSVPTVRFESLDAFDVVFDPKALCVDDALIIWRVVLSKARAMQMKTLDRDGLSMLEEVEGGAPSQPSDASKQARKRVFGVQGAPEDTAHDPSELELLCAFGDIEIDGELHENQIVVVGNRRVLLRAEEETFWAGRPIGWGGYDQLWMTGYEKGPLEPIRGIQSLVDTFQNQKADVLNLIINGAFAYVNDGIIDPDNLWLRPGGFIEVGDLNNIKALNPSQNVALTYTEIAQLRDQGERSSGKSRFDMGQAPGGRRTAYEANLIRGGGSSRSNDVLRHLANGPMEHYLTWAMGTLQQLKWDSGEISNEVLGGQYRLQYLGADLTVLRNFQIPNFQMALQIAAQAPPEMTADVNFRYIFQQLFRALTMDDEKALLSEAEAAQRRQELKQQQAMAQRQIPSGQSGSEEGGQDADLMALLQGAEMAA